MNDKQEYNQCLVPEIVMTRNKGKNEVEKPRKTQGDTGEGDLGDRAKRRMGCWQGEQETEGAPQEGPKEA